MNSKTAHDSGAIGTPHTPGPWEVDPTARDYMGQLIIMAPCPDQGRKPVAHVQVEGKGNKTSFTAVQLARANLIAAAPDLRDELQKAHQIILNALAVMTTEKKTEWGRLNARDGVDGEGITRANERMAVLAKATGSAA